jgi:GNAT superfamily N-acetyltransferase
MPSDNPTIRTATRDDLPRLLALWAQLAPPADHDTVAPSDVEHAAFDIVLHDDHQHVLVLEHDGALVATLILMLIPNVTHNGRPYAIAELVVTDEAHRGHGHGETLMRHALDLARKARAYKLVLTSAAHRADAHRFYTRLGFRAASTGFRIDL